MLVGVVVVGSRDDGGLGCLLSALVEVRILRDGYSATATIVFTAKPLKVVRRSTPRRGWVSGRSDEHVEDFFRAVAWGPRKTSALSISLPHETAWDVE